MAKSFLEECQARLKHQLSDYWGGKAALAAFIVHKNSGIYLHKELIESPQLCHSRSFILVEEASENPARAISAEAKVCAWWQISRPGLPHGWRQPNRRGESAQDSSQGLTLPTEASHQATQGLPVLSLEMQMGKK